MVHKCVVCRANSKQHNDLSFHLFPKDHRQALWMNILGLSEISTWNRVCSKHFGPESYSNVGSRMVLLRDAMPLTAESLSTIQVTPKTPEFKITSQTSTPIVTSKRKLFDSTISPTKISPAKKTPSNSNRFGDLGVDDFGSPNRAKRNFPVISSVIAGLKKKNKCLTEKNRRLENKVQSLQCIVKELQSKSLISDAAADNLKALGSDVLNKLIFNALDGKRMYTEEIILRNDYGH